MKFTLVAVSAALAGFVSAQSTNVGNLPTCVQGCVGDLLPQRCNLNPDCICKDATFITNISCCIAGACPASDQQAAIGFARSICIPAGASVPASATCAPGSTYVVGSTGSAAATTTGTSSSGTAATTTASSSSVVNTAGSTLAVTGSGMSSAASTAAASPTRNAGDKLAAQGISLLGAVAGAVALL